VIGLVVHEYRQQNNDRQRNADEPKEQSFSKSHCNPPVMVSFMLNEKRNQKFREKRTIGKSREPTAPIDDVTLFASGDFN
jgi:hypothetical protein